MLIKSFFNAEKTDILERLVVVAAESVELISTYNNNKYV